MKTMMFSAATTAALVTSSASASLILTGAFDGPLPGGLPKVVELYATADIADLSTYGVGAANNGGGTDGVELALSGSASEGDFLYVVDGSADFATYFGFTPTLLFDGSFANGGAASINGDDAIELFDNVTTNDAGTPGDPGDDFLEGTVIDVFGDINVDGTGQPWDCLLYTSL